MIKVLWFCNVEFSVKESTTTGTWLHTMANELIDTEEVQLFNITQASVKNITQRDSKSICQWLVPFEKVKSNGLPGIRIIQQIQKIVDFIKPDIILTHHRPLKI